MIKTYLCIAIAGSIFVQTLQAQHFSGAVYSANGQPAVEAVVAPLVEGGHAMAKKTDSLGRFVFHFESGEIDSLQIQVSAPGLQMTQCWIYPRKPAEIRLNPYNLVEVEVEDRQKGTMISIHTIPTEIMTRTELGRAACCNLSESFETNPTVDVSLSDAVTGAKTLRMLGMDGKYVQITSEMLPGIRGIASSFGLNYIPGPWMESVQVSKGTGSVVNGYEALTGQINLEFLKPEKAEPWYVNVYVNHMGRAELNLQHANVLNPRWSVLTLLHASRIDNYMDRNGDGFLDVPVSYTLSGMHRWKYQGKKREAQFGIRALREKREGGTRSWFVPDTMNKPIWHYALTTMRIEVLGKHGFLFPEKPYKSIGLMASGLYHEQSGQYGPRSYYGRQISGYFNGIYQTIISDTRHTFKTGVSFSWDDVHEVSDTLRFIRNERVPGAFAEYTYSGLSGFSAVLGMRADYHNLYGLQATPRVHMKWEINPVITWRVSGGTGFRIPNILADNLGALVSGRQLMWKGEIKPERAWTSGTGIVLSFFEKRPITISADLWFTYFTSRLITDREQIGILAFYMSDEPAQSLVSQTDITWDMFPWLELRGSYKYQYVTAYYEGVRKQEPLVPEHRLLFTSMITWKKPGLQFDITTQITGPTRIPERFDYQSGNVFTDRSPWFAMLHAQVKWQQNKSFEWYIGGENLLNFTQPDPILNPYIPNHMVFDGSMAWGPVFGTMVYAGVKWTFHHKDE